MRPAAIRRVDGGAGERARARERRGSHPFSCAWSSRSTSALPVTTPGLTDAGSFVAFVSVDIDRVVRGAKRARAAGAKPDADAKRQRMTATACAARKERSEASARVSARGRALPRSPRRRERVTAPASLLPARGAHLHSASGIV